jgi:2',3'-cyclic-nucleotide 2'-phosphodiesterase (5'-nucleotidase family)
VFSAALLPAAAAVAFPSAAASDLLTNRLKIDRNWAQTLGNHEFSFPAPVLRNYLKNITFPMLGAW